MRSRWNGWKPLLLHPGFLVPLALLAIAQATDVGDARVLGSLLVAVTIVRAIAGAAADRWVLGAAVRLATVVGQVLFGLVYVVALVPAHLASRRAWRRERRAAPTWTAHHTSGPDATHLGSSEAARPRTHPVLRAIGLVSIVLAGNYLLGAAWDRVAPRHPGAGAAAPPPTLINVSGREAPRDPRSDDPAMGGAPWAEGHFDELNAIEVDYWPFVLFRNRPYQGDHVNGEGWTRRSYEAPRAAGAARPLLSFYGGSTMFGIGQRDEHTIPSQLARIAAAEGYPVDVANHGMSGFVSWQEMLLFEHFTREGERPLRAVFYDGSNDVYAQRQEAIAGHPANTEVAQVSARLASTPAGTDVPWDQPVRAERGWRDLYSEHSAVHRVIEELRDALGSDPAGAAVLGDDRGPEEIGRDAVEVYERSRALIEAIAEPAGVTPAFFWQPVPGWDDPASAYFAAHEQLSPPTTSVADCLDDHQEVYLADAHTNETGARLVAACLWSELGPVVRAWYRSEGVPRQPLLPASLDEDDLLPTLPRAQLPIDDEVLAGWTDAIAIPNVVATCAIEAGDGTSAATGPSFARSAGSSIGRLTTSVLTVADPGQRAATIRQLREAEGVACLARSARDLLAVDGQVTFTRPVDEAPGTTRWEARVRFGSIEQDGVLVLALVERGDDLVALTATGAGPEIGTEEAVSLAVSALLSE